MIKLIAFPWFRRAGGFLSLAPRLFCSQQQARYNYPPELESAVNKQINHELLSSHIYLSMATHFAQTSVALTGASGLLHR